MIKKSLLILEWIKWNKNRFQSIKNKFYVTIKVSQKKFGDHDFYFLSI